MACCRQDPSQDGYATPAALVVGLTIALLATGLLARSASDLRSARYDFQRLRMEQALEGAHLVAASAIISSRREGPYRWTETTDLGRVEIVAEPEKSKLGADKAAQLPDSALSQLGVNDLAALRERLTSAADQQGHVMISDLDAATSWRFCAPSVISIFGQADALTYVPPTEPGAGPLPSSWHIGEAWLVSVATPDGWRDNRIVRFTGDAQRPTAIVTRRFFRTTTTGEQRGCEELLNALAAG